MPSLISLFTGAGGLDLGLEKAGFRVKLCVENDYYCQQTLKKNRPRWRLAQPPDIFKLKPTDALRQAHLQSRELDLLAGGPPCQPFSKASYWHKGDSLRLKDPRSETLKSYLKMVDVLLPKAILLENVEGIQFAKKDEAMQLLLAGLERINKKRRTSYKPTTIVVNMADYGVPQFRKRVLLVAARDGSEFSFPQPSHGIGLASPYITSWDAIGDLDFQINDPTLKLKGRWGNLLPTIPEGWNYQWHTSHGGGKSIFGFRRRYWSFLLKLSKDRPSWTIQAQPGPSTGPFHWKNRLLSVRELCRIQTFPDDYQIAGPYRAAQSQIGNAVPPLIGELLGKEILRQILHKEISATFSFAIKHRDTPRAERRHRIPMIYHHLIGNHRPHPGTGRGPGAIARSIAA